MGIQKVRILNLQDVVFHFKSLCLIRSIALSTFYSVFSSSEFGNMFGLWVVGTVKLYISLSDYVIWRCTPGLGIT